MHIQKIYFGSPGTGKSHKIENDCLSTLGIAKDSENHIHTVFHPEYTYGDFMGKLVPLTRGGKVEYKFRSGHFLRALGQAYKNIIAATNKPNVALVIDEINRGNCAAIFGSVFQLLDRAQSEWSSYAVTLNEIEFEALLREMGYGIGTNEKGDPVYFDATGNAIANIDDQLKNVVHELREDDRWELSSEPKKMSVKIPPNLSIIASMNTSDNSIYLMDSAFKRRWAWEFLDWEEVKDLSERRLDQINPDTAFSWVEAPTVTHNESTCYRWAPHGEVKASFIVELNRFIKSHYESIRGIEDKQIGPFFFPPHVNPIPKSATGGTSDESIEGKLMHFVWDTIFSRDKRPLLDVLNEYYKIKQKKPLPKRELVTFGDFVKLTEDFVNAIMMPRCEWNGNLVPAAEWNGNLVPAAEWNGTLQPAVSREGILVPMQTEGRWKKVIQHIRSEEFGLKTAHNQPRNSIPLPRELKPDDPEGPEDLKAVVNAITEGVIKKAVIAAINDAAGKTWDSLGNG